MPAVFGGSGGCGEEGQRRIIRRIDGGGEVEEGVGLVRGGADGREELEDEDLAGGGRRRADEAGDGGVARCQVAVLLAFGAPRRGEFEEDGAVVLVLVVLVLVLVLVLVPERQDL